MPNMDCPIAADNVFGPVLVSTAYLCLQVAILAAYCTLSTIRTNASIAAVALSALAAFVVSILSYLEHERSPAPSSLLFLFLLLTSIFDIARVRTLWTIGETAAIAGIFSASLAMKLVMVVLESWSKRKYLAYDSRDRPREELAGFFSRTVFLWLGPLLLSGFRKWLVPSDLGPIDQALRSDMRPRQSGRNSLLHETVRSIGCDIAKPIIPRLCFAAVSLSQPFLVSSILEYMQDPEPASKNNSYGLIGACFFVYSGIAISSSWYRHLNDRFVTMIRRILVSSIFEKTLRLRGNPELASRAMTLMIADVQGVVSGMTNIHEVWAGVIETGIAAWLLQRQVGLACLPVVGLGIGCALLSTQVAKLSGTRQQVWFASMQKRLRSTSTTISSFKAIKLLGAENRAIAQIKSLREQEISAAKPFRSLLIIAVMLAYSTLTLSPVLAVGTYISLSIHQDDFLGTTRLFTTLILISLLASPLVHLFQVLPVIGAARGCFSRIELYLKLEERTDYRVIEDRKSFDGSPKHLDHVAKSREPISINQAEVTISIKRASFAWKKQGFSIVNNLTMDIQRGEHIAIVGLVGVGKSLLLNAIIGEAEQVAGSTCISTANISYCSQTPWLENISAEKNISQGLTDDEDWLRLVAHACALEDVQQLQEYRTGSVGSGGANLSGGQRQRIALARAIFARNDILIMDDPFSALDKTTRSLISARLMGPRGLLRRLGTTVIYATHSDHFQKSADRVFEILRDGRVIEHSRKPKPQNLYDPTAQARPSSFVSPNAPTVKETDAETISSQKDGRKKLMEDKEVYKTYYNSIGFAQGMVFSTSSIIFAFTLKFPDVWVQWWSTANSENSSKSIGYWMGIYAVLEVLPLLTLVFWVW
ncbi:hypothetical protein V498_05885 [Pseudogymnoascus sp. VKM F-4517 (FW-2822)]|nr:hypothetical protein V498_05885 [Pseudogymnoascus sp. VKM F-4517 (FW-2822)]